MLDKRHTLTVIFPSVVFKCMICGKCIPPSTTIVAFDVSTERPSSAENDGNSSIISMEAQNGLSLVVSAYTLGFNNNDSRVLDIRTSKISAILLPCVTCFIWIRSLWYCSASFTSNRTVVWLISSLRRTWTVPF